MMSTNFCSIMVLSLCILQILEGIRIFQVRVIPNS